MQINKISSYNQNFQQRIKFNKPKLEILAKSAIGVSASAAGAASIAEGAFSANAVFNHHPYSIESIPNDVVNSHKGMLTSAGRRYDAAGVVEGVPVQSTVAPVGMTASGITSSVGSSNAFNNAFGEDNLKASTVIPLDASKIASANKSVQNSALGSGYLGTAAGSLYSGINIDEVNNMLPESAKFKDYELETLEQVSLTTGGVSVSAPIASGFSKVFDKVSNTKSSQFVSDTLVNENASKKIPS